MKRIKKEYENSNKKLFDYIRSSVNTNEEAEDILQDVFVTAVLNFNTLESINNITSWLYTVAKNKVIDLFRKRREITEADYSNDVNLEELIADSGISIEDGVTEKWVMEEIEMAIDLLPENQKEVFILHEIKGYSYKKIHEITGVPVNTLLSRKRYAVKSLRAELEDIYYELYEE